MNNSDMRAVVVPGDQKISWLYAATNRARRLIREMNDDPRAWAVWRRLDELVAKHSLYSGRFPYDYYGAELRTDLWRCKGCGMVDTTDDYPIHPEITQAQVDRASRANLMGHFYCEPCDAELETREWKKESTRVQREVVVEEDDSQVGPYDENDNTWGLAGRIQPVADTFDAFEAYDDPFQDE